MNGDSSRCPSPEALAAFVAGKLSGDDLRMTADHLLDCEDCRMIVGEAAFVERAEREPVAARSRRLWWWLAAAAAAIASVAYLTWRAPAPTDAAGIQLLVDAAPRDGRYVEPRLTGGFRWAPLRPAIRTGSRDLDPGQMKLVGAAGSVLERARRDSSPEAKHASAIAHLVAGRPDESTAELLDLAQTMSDARIWNDLAASRYQTALQKDDPSQLAEALAAADAALRVDPGLAEALFNRALIIEQLGLRDQARAAWQRYLVTDSESSWAVEARQHLQKLQPVTEFRHELERQYDTLTADAEAARALARRFPQEARVWGESEILSRWAHAQKARKPDSATAHLRVAKAFGEQIAKTSGEQMLAEAVVAIERSDVAGRAELADAHIALREAQKMYKTGRIGEAERLFASAAPRFERSGSPVALLASALEANTIYDQGRIPEARMRLERLLSTAPVSFSAHRAQVEWQLGLVYASIGRWGDAMHALKQSIATFERLNEKNYATSVREILAQLYDRIGDPQTAWHHRMVAMQELGRSVSKRLKIAIEAAGRTAATARNWPVSLSFLGLQLELSRDKGEEFLYFQTLLLRARIAGQMEQTATARGDLQLAAAAMQRVTDPALRERAAADQVAVEGILAGSTPEAVPLLTRAIDFHAQKGRRMFLPDLLLHRGRAFFALRDSGAAAADFERGITELETQRLSIGAGEERWGMFAAADDLFEEALVLAHSRGDDLAAFQYAERARARELLEAISDTRPVLARTFGSDVLIIEYASLPARLMIFVVGRGGVRVVEETVRRAELSAYVDGMTRSAMSGDRPQFRRNASALYQRLLAPIAADTNTARTLVFVPDATLSGVPFAALVDGSGRYVIEQHAVVVAPSAAVFSRLGAQSRGQRHDLHLLVVAGPSSSDGAMVPLAETASERNAVAAAYRGVVSLTADGGDPDVFAARAADADVIHFVGHAEGGDNADAALLTTRGESGDDRLDVREIARMNLGQIRTIVLAACSTARGQQRTGEGTISVARAFLAAGVPSVVATLWPIEDAAAAAFFPRLHHHLARGAAPAEALRAAQLECIHRQDAEPAMWASVQIIGS